MKTRWLFLLSLAAASAVALSAMSKTQETKRTMFLPPSLADDWTKWIVGEWEGTGESDSGKGRVRVRIAPDLGGQFLIHRGEATITELDPEYLKTHMHASDEELERFKRSGYQSLEIYTIDQETGEVIGFLFDNLRCMAKGRGKREGFKDTIEWEWSSGHKSTRITERVSDDRLVGIERTRNADGTIMEDRGEMVRKKPLPVSEESGVCRKAYPSR